MFNKPNTNIFGAAQNNSPFGQPQANNVFGNNNNAAQANVFGGNRSTNLIRQIQQAIILLLIIRLPTIFLVRPTNKIIHPSGKIIKGIILLQQIILPIQGQEYLGKTTTLQRTLSLVKILTIKVIINLKTIIMVFLGRIITQAAIPYLMPAHKEQAFLVITPKVDKIMLIPQFLAQIHKISPIINLIKCLINLIILLLQWLELGIILNNSYNKVSLQSIYYLQLHSFNKII